MNTNRRLAVALFLFVSLLLTTILAAPKIAEAASQCSCLVYFQRATGLPATGDANFRAENYASWLSNKRNSAGRLEYNVSYLRPSTSSPSSLNNSYLIWSRSRMGNCCGHIAIVSSASYNSSTKMWTFYFKDANSSWSSSQRLQGPFTERDCNNVYSIKWTTNNLSGLTFFRASRR